MGSDMKTMIKWAIAIVLVAAVAVPILIFSMEDQETNDTANDTMQEANDTMPDIEDELSYDIIRSGTYTFTNLL